MSALLKKDLRLVLHPTALLFLGLSAMVLIPSYPYYVLFFYTCLGIFFTCLNGREFDDLPFTMTLPVRKRDIVRARFLLAVLLELAQMAVTALLALLRGVLIPMENPVGMEANTAFFGLSFLLLGLFHLIFFRIYFRNPQRVGVAFLWGSLAVFLYITVMETLTHILPFFRDCLDTPDPRFLGEKLPVLGIGILGYGLMTLLALRRAERNFEALDL